MDTVIWLLEKTLAHLCHSFLVLTYLLRDSDEHAQFWRQVNILALLLYFKQRLIKLFYFFVVLLFEVSDHGNSSPCISLLELTSVWVHVKSYIADFVGLVVSVASHYNGSFEFINDCFLDLVG